MVPPYVAIGGVDNGELVIGAVFNNWNKANLDISLYGPGAITRGAIRAIYHYVFKQSKATRLSAITRRSNKLMRQKLHKLGFREEGVSKRYFGPRRADDAFRYVLFPQDAERWMK